MIREAHSNDADSVHRLIAASGLFSDGEIDEVFGVYHAFCSGELGDGHVWAVFEGEASLLGTAYFAPEALSNDVWNLYFIAVLPEAKGQGVGTNLVSYVEQKISKRSGRLLIVETSGLDSFEPTRDFYLRCGFEEAGRIRDYYAKGEAKVIFLKDTIVP